ncbi:hypothetical protein B0H11DRAFT_1959274 [Mycena galericulata]|nr:hypothetical protein B0H11DRAFT_1959274 [Mycena galericulata]
MAVFSPASSPAATSAYAPPNSALLRFLCPNRTKSTMIWGGAAGFLSTAFISLYYPALKNKFFGGVTVPGPLPSIMSFAPRQLLLSAALGIWSVRLGSFLAHRAIKAGGDSRFEEVKKNPKRFTYFWLAQATWVLLVGLPVYMVNSLPAPLHPALAIRDYAAFGLFAGSLLFEVIADRQKTAWRRAKDAKQHDEKFITRGLWSISRHPKYISFLYLPRSVAKMCLSYVGEVGIWTGIWALAAGTLQTAHFPLGTVSGVPPLERAGDKKFGGDPKWEEYKRTVPVFWPWGSTN